MAMSLCDWRPCSDASGQLKKDLKQYNSDFRPCSDNPVPSVLHRQVLELEDSLRTKNRELQDAVLSCQTADNMRRQAESANSRARSTVTQLKGMFEKHASVVQEEVSKLRKVAETQQNEIKHLQRQLQLERDAASAAKGSGQALCFSDADWPEELNEAYITDKVPLGARTFAMDLLRHVRMVRTNKEQKIRQLAAEKDQLHYKLEQEHRRNEENARTSAKLHREIEHWKAQAIKVQSAYVNEQKKPRCRLAPAPAAMPPGTTPPDRLQRRVSSAVDHLDRTAARLKDLFTTSHHDTVTVRPGSGSPGTYTPVYGREPLYSPYVDRASHSRSSNDYSSHCAFYVSPSTSPASYPINETTLSYPGSSSPAGPGVVKSDSQPQSGTCANLYCQANNYCLRKGAGRPPCCASSP